MIITTTLAFAVCTAQSSSSASALAPPMTSVPTEVAAVTVHPDRARVTRRTADLTEDGRYRFEGLPGSLDPDSIRAGVPGGHVLSLELRPRESAAPPSARLAALQDEQDALDARRAVLADEYEVLNILERGLQQLTPTSADRTTVGDPSTWVQATSFLTEQATHDAARRRELDKRDEELDRLQADLNRRRGDLVAPSGPSYDVLLELDVPDAGGPAEVEYLVPNAGWAPRYELRTASDARSVGVAYRASVWQSSGEDWDGVRLALSTAEPRRGTAAPSIETRWAHIVDRHSIGRLMDREAGGERLRLEKEVGIDYRGLGVAAADPTPSPVALVNDAGLSLLYELPSTDTVLSGSSPTSVLIGAVELGITPEYHCVPALDTTVWLRGRAQNSSNLVFLPGDAAVFFGADHLGDARLDLVRPGQEFVLHLGPDPALEVTRRMIDEGTEGAGFFGSKDTWHRKWSIRIENHGASITGADGAAAVYVREAIPRSTDDRVTVEVDDVNQPLAKGELWDREREDLGIETWVVRVPRGGEAELRYELRIRHPEDAELRFR